MIQTITITDLVTQKFQESGLPDDNGDLDYLYFMVQGYLEVYLWVEMIWVDDVLSNGGSIEVHLDELTDVGQGFDFQPEFLTEVVDAIIKFYAENKDDLRTVQPWCDSGSQAGHDLHLTANEHGVGFWDRTNDPAAQRLTKASQERFEFYSDGWGYAALVDDVLILPPEYNAEIKPELWDTLGDYVPFMFTSSGDPIKRTSSV